MSIKASPEYTCYGIRVWTRPKQEWGNMIAERRDRHLTDEEVAAAVENWERRRKKTVLRWERYETRGYDLYF